MKKLKHEIPLITDEQVEMIADRLHYEHSNNPLFKKLEKAMDENLLEKAIKGMKDTMKEVNQDIMLKNAKNEVLRDSKNYGTKRNKVNRKD